MSLWRLFRFPSHRARSNRFFVAVFSCFRRLRMGWKTKALWRDSGFPKDRFLLPWILPSFGSLEGGSRLRQTLHLSPVEITPPLSALDDLKVTLEEIRLSRHCQCRPNSRAVVLTGRFCPHIPRYFFVSKTRGMEPMSSHGFDC